MLSSARFCILLYKSLRVVFFKTQSTYNKVRLNTRHFRKLFQVILHLFYEQTMHNS